MASTQVMTTQVVTEPDVQRHDVTTTMVYFDGSEPEVIRLFPDRLEGSRPKVDVEVTVQDVTGEQDRFSIPKHGFRWLPHQTKVPLETLYSDEVIERDYYPEVEEAIREQTGAKRVKIFDHKVRTGGQGYEQPLFRVHVDQSYHGAELMLNRHMGEEAADLKKGHWQIFNFWRPLKVVETDPLAMMDGSTASDADLFPGPISYEATGVKVETWMVKHSQGQKWYYKHRQTPDEVLLFKCFDSEEGNDQIVRRTPHSAFVDPANLACEGKWRHSIEVRCLAFL